MVDWQFAPKTYPHFDQVVRTQDAALSLVLNPEAVAQHPFFPFIEYKIAHRKLSKALKKREAENNHGDPSSIVVRKPRSIKYASHKDAVIYSYYRDLIAEKYEEKILNFGLNENIIAYRKIPISSGSTKNKCNIHFAKEAFEEIASRGNCIALTFDIEGFFESLDHEFLYKKWCEILGLEKLPSDHMHIYKNITNYSCVSRDESYEKLGYIENISGKKKFKICPHKLKKKKKMLCNKSDYRNKICDADIIKKNEIDEGVPRGIPQGSPISDVLANLYMLEFDALMVNLQKKYNAYYRRYSDDILWICSAEHASDIEKHTKDAIVNQGSGTLKIHDKKSTRTLFAKNNDKINYLNINESGGACDNHQKMFTYLGFSFNGEKSFFRESTLGRYKRNVTFSVRSFVTRAIEANYREAVGFDAARESKENLLKKYLTAKKEGKTLQKSINVSIIFHKNAFLNKDSNSLKFQLGNFCKKVSNHSFSDKQKLEIANSICAVLGSDITISLSPVNIKELNRFLVSAIVKKYPDEPDQMKAFVDALAEHMGKNYPFKNQKNRGSKLDKKRSYSEGNFMSYSLRAKKIFNHTGSVCPLSFSQLDSHRAFVRDCIIKEAQKYEPEYSLP